MDETAISIGATALLQSTSHIPISQLTPLLAEPAARSVKAIVTLTWPYSSATGSVAFLLAEPDFRLRRTRGQVRVQFSGSSAKAVAKSGISSGDEVILCLDGVAWVHDEAPFATPGRGLEFELKFKERLLLQFRQEDYPEIGLIDVNYPTPEPEPEPPGEGIIPSPDPAPAPSTIVGSNSLSARTGLVRKNGDEWSSPAFIKRARTSYGSLFDDDYDPFAEEDGTIRGKGRKRTRLSSTWRYDSRSPSPEVDGLEETSVKLMSAEPVARSTLTMTDEGSQTVGIEVGSTNEVLAEFSRQDTNASSNDPEANGRELLEDPAQPHIDSDASDHHHTVRHTQLDSNTTDSGEHEVHEASVERTVPWPPRLQPLLSASLPLVSPLVTSSFGTFPALAREHGVVEQSQHFSDELVVPIEEPIQLVEEDEQEDQYGVSSAGRLEPYTMSDVNGFEDSSIDNHSSMHVDNRFISEDLYSQWQSPTAQLSHSDSPLKVAQEVGETHERFFVEEGEERQAQYDGLPISGAEEPHLHQYPDLDAQSLGHPIDAPWGPGRAAIPYPDLPDSDRGLNNGLVVQNSPYPGLPTLSRSQSAQSAVVDLTESDDEEVEEEGSNEGSNEGSTVEKVYDSSEGGSVNEEEQQAEQGAVRSQYFQTDDTHMADEDVAEGSQDEEPFYEEFEGNENYDNYHPGFNPDQEGDFSAEEEEESYDEGDLEDEEQASRYPEQREPVVIDLLSSDEDDDDDEEKEEEEGGETFAPMPAISPSESATSPRQILKASFDILSDDVPSQSDEDMDAEEGMELTANVLSRAPSTEEDEDEPFVVEEEDPIVNPTEDDALIVDASSDNGRANEVRIERHEDAATAQRIAPSEDGKGTGFSEGSEAKGEDLEPELPTDYLRQDDHVEMEVEVSIKIPDAKGRNGTPDQDEELGHAFVDVVSPEQPSENESKQDKTSLSPRMFNLDGANDEPRDVSYAVLRRDDRITPPATTSGSEQHSQIMSSPDDQRIKHTNDQLPTPDATQLSQAKLASEESVSSGTEVPLPLPPHALQNASNDVTLGPLLENALVSAAKEEEISSVENSKDGIETETTRTTEAETSSREISKINFEADNVETDNIEINKDGKVALVTSEVRNTRSHARQQDGQSEPGHIEPLEIPDDSIHFSPRRSHRRTKSTGSTADSSQTARPVTPIMSGARADPIEPRSVRTDRSSSIILDDPATPKGHDASIELAMSALDSPTNLQQDVHRPPIGGLKVQLSRALRTELSEFTALKVLRYHLTQKLDVLAVATTSPPEPQRAKGGPRQYQIIFNITDPSIAPSSVTEVQVFRPYREALPIVKAGDGILLRNFQVISVKNRGFALRSEQSQASSWAVFKSDSDEGEVRGPPVEYGAGEKNHILALRTWYKGLDSIALAKLNRANADKSAIGAGTAVGKGS